MITDADVARFEQLHAEFSLLEEALAGANELELLAKVSGYVTDYKAGLSKALRYKEYVALRTRCAPFFYERMKEAGK